MVSQVKPDFFFFGITSGPGDFPFKNDNLKTQNICLN